MWKKEEDKILIDSYNAGFSLGKIAEIMNRSYDSVKARSHKLKDTGLIQEKDIKGLKKRLIKEDFLNGMDLKEIAKKYDITTEHTATYIREMRKKGELPPIEKPIKEEKKKREPKEASHAFVEREVKKTREAVPTYDHPIECNEEVAKTCVYGSATSSNGFCRFAQCTGKCRSVTTEGFIGCSYKACIRYSKISKGNPRIESLDAM